MGRSPIFACVIALLVSSGAGAQPRRMTNAPGEVTVAGAHSLIGHFDIREAAPDEPGIMSVGGGGACLIGRLPGALLDCKVSNDCPTFRRHAGKFNDHIERDGLCVRESPTDEIGTCWLLPPDGLKETHGLPCARRYAVDGKEIGTGKYDTPDFDPSTYLDHPDLKQWRVYSCLNGDPGACGPKGGVEGQTVLHLAGFVTPRITQIWYERKWGIYRLQFPIFVWLGILAAALILSAFVVRRTLRQPS